LPPREIQLVDRPRPEPFTAPTPAASPRERGKRLRRILLMSDLAALVIAAPGATLLISGNQAMISNEEQLITLLVCVPALFVLAHASGLYHLVDRHMDYSFAEELGPTFMAVTVWTFLLLMASSVVAGSALKVTWFAGSGLLRWSGFCSAAASCGGSRLVPTGTARTQC